VSAGRFAPARWTGRPISLSILKKSHDLALIAQCGGRRERERWIRNFDSSAA